MLRHGNDSVTALTSGNRDTWMPRGLGNDNYVAELQVRVASITHTGAQQGSDKTGLPERWEI